MILFGMNTYKLRLFTVLISHFCGFSRNSIKQNFIFYCIAFLLCTSTSIKGWNDSSRSDKPLLPELNVYGKLNGTEVTYITINNLYKHIPFYLVPFDKDGDPRDSIVKISLISDGPQPAVKSISLSEKIKHHGDNTTVGIGPEITYGDSKFLLLTLTFSSGAQREYLIDADSTINCYERVLNVEWKMGIKELHSLIIDGYETEEQKRSKKQPDNKPSSGSEAQKAVCQIHKDTISNLKKESSPRSQRTNELVDRLENEAMMLCQEE